MEIIKTVNLTKKYKDVVAVDNLNLSVFKGEIFSLLGVNGAGKTTTIKMLSTLTRPTSGTAYIKGNDVVTRSSAVKEIIALSPQETAVAPKLTTKENLEFICGIYGFSKKKTQSKTKELTALLGLEKVIDKRADKLSGGMKRRLSIALSLISEPEVLFLDEPTLGLDVLSRSELWDLILSLKGRVTIILTTHYMEEAEHLSDRIAIMKEGKLLFVGKSQEIKEIAGEENFEQAFIKIVKGDKK